jgi:lipoprotein-anchoring transpeptidase ErfK/SrfK
MIQYPMSNKYKGLRESVSCLVCLLFFINGRAQAPLHNNEKDLPAPRNLKVLEEHKDAKGNTVRTLQYQQGKNRITETVIIPATSSINTRIPINADTLNKDSVMVVINKSKYNLEVFYRRRMIRYYKAVFGPKPLENKRMEGDRCTPEGWFTIQSKSPVSKYDKFMLLNYPNDSSIAAFNRLKANGMIPKTAGIGGSVGIHGIWKGGDDLIEQCVGWTDGCIAIKNKDIEELYSFVGVGTKVYIRR